ncbi:hypothetical protein [Qipengyuania sp. NPDC077563]|uniref:hypothetical protein n=1 Tax=Qipengyuania sp. NPDC077563 TaxID=3364497 RepID=UPI00384BCF42
MKTKLFFICLVFMASAACAVPEENTERDGILNSDSSITSRYLKAIDYFLVSGDSDRYFFSAWRLDLPSRESTFIEGIVRPPTEKMKEAASFRERELQAGESRHVLSPGKPVVEMLSEYRSDLNGADETWRVGYGAPIFLFSNRLDLDRTLDALATDQTVTTVALDPNERDCIFVSGSSPRSGHELRTLFIVMADDQIGFADPAFARCMGAFMLLYQGAIHEFSEQALDAAVDWHTGTLSGSCIVGIVRSRSQFLAQGEPSAEAPFFGIAGDSSACDPRGKVTIDNQD